MVNFFVDLANQRDQVKIPEIKPPSFNAAKKVATENLGAPVKATPDLAAGPKPGLASRVFNWVKDRTPSVGGPEILNFLGGTTIGKKALNAQFVKNQVRNILLGQTNFTQLSSEYSDRLKGLEGNDNLVRAIDLLSPKIADEIKKKIAGDDTPGAEEKAKAKGKENGKFKGFKTFLDKDTVFFNEMIRAICYKVAVNFAEYVKGKNGTEGENGTDIVKEIIKLAFEDFDNLYEEFNKIDQIPCEKTKEKKFQELFAPVALKFMKIALPGGQADLNILDGVKLPLLPTIGFAGGVASAAWKVVSHEVIPEILVDAMRLVKKPNFHTDEDLKILDRPGGAALQRLAKFIGDQTVKVAPELLDEKCAEIAEAFLEKFVDDPNDHIDTMRWIGRKIQEFALSQDAAVKQIWNVSGQNVESIMLRAFASLAKDGKGNLIPIAAGKGLAFIDNFLEKNKKIVDQGFLETEPLPLKEKLKKRAGLFQPLADEIIKACGLFDNELVDAVRTGPLPAILREFYQDMSRYEGNTSDFRERLTNFLFDPEAYISEKGEFRTGYVEALKSPSKAKKEAHKRSGIRSVVEDLSKSCGVLAQVATKVAKEFASEDREQIARLVNNGVFEDYKLNDQEQKEFADGLHEFLGTDHPSLTKTWEYGQTIVEAVLLKVLTSVAESNPVQGMEGRTRNKNEILAGNVIHRLLSTLTERIPSIDQRLMSLKLSDKDEKVKRQEIYELFQPLAKDFLAMAGDHVDDIFPVPDFLKRSLREKLETLFLPAIFYEVYTDLNQWRYEIPHTSKEVETILGSKSGVNTVNTLADYIKDFVPYYMETNPDKITEVVLKSGGKYLDFLSKENKEQLGAMITKNIHLLGKDSVVKESAQAISEYSKGMILKIFTGVLRNIDGKEKASANGKGNSDFLLTTGIGFIKVATDYFRRVNKIPPGGRDYAAYLVGHDTMLKGFAENGELHKAMMKDLDPHATPEEMREQRLKEFFVPFAQNLLEISGVDNPNDFPVPAPMRDEMWKLFKEEMLPQAMMNVFEDLLKPDSINDLMLKVVDSLLEEVDSFNKMIDTEEEVVINDPKQRELNAALGSLVKEMIDLVPEFWVKTVFKIEKVKGMTAEALGQIVRKKLDGQTLISYLDQMLTGFTMNKADADRGKTESDLYIEKQKKEMELNGKLKRYISNQLKDTAKNIIKSKWNGFQKSFDEQVHKYFGKPGAALKKFFDKILNVIFIKGLGSIANFVIFKAIWFFVDMKIASKSKEIIKDTHMPIHENLVYKFCDTWTDIMKKKRRKEAAEDEKEANSKI